MGEKSNVIESKMKNIVAGPIKVIDLHSVSFQYPERSQVDNESLQNCPVPSEEGDGRGKSTTCKLSDEGLDEKSEISREESCPRTKALQDVTFRFECGKVYSIVGKNGSGKSTLGNLLTKFYEPSQGYISANGSNLSGIFSSSWLKNLAVMPQKNAFLYNATIRENIGLGLPSLLEDDPDNILEEEAKALEITSFVGLDTFLGDKESSKDIPGYEKDEWIDDLSGGQFQTIALARTFCRKKSSNVFLFDEPSSNLDPQKEHDLFERLKREKSGRITIFISHNLKTCRASDCILVMDEGRLVQSGSHSDLLQEEDGIYANLYRLQNETWQDEK